MTIRVKKPSGLSLGYHEVIVSCGYSISYMPPQFNHFDDNIENLCPCGNFGSNSAKRTMLIV